MIHMNLIAVAERSSSIGSVSQHVHVTNVADVERRVKRKYLTIAAAAVFLLSEGAAYITRQVIEIDGGM